MYELYPYFTNDSSVGLFSRQDDDIYHSSYGALSESWQKFIIPSGLEKYVQEHRSVKILDICYGIGYNTKTSLHVFIKNFFKQNKNPNKISTKKIKKSHVSPPTIAAIDTDNIMQVANDNSNEKNLHAYSMFVPISIAQIDTNNIKWGAEENFHTNSGIKPEMLTNLETESSDLEDAENDFDYGYAHFGYDSICNTHYGDDKNRKNYCDNILIDAVDLDKTLIYLSPFIAGASWFNFLFKQNYEISNLNQYKYNQIQNLKSFKKFIKKEFKLCKETSIILFKKLMDKNPDFFNDKILQTILHHKKFAPFLSRFMIDFAKFYLKRGYKYNKKGIKSTFLHNIYYRYLTRSYKNTKKLLKNCKINVNLHKNDARNFVRENNQTYNFIFLDAFTPAKCPNLWTLEFIKELYYKLEDDGMILTYSNSAAVRNAFLQNGFSVGKIYDPHLKKFTGTVATKNKFLIQHPLDGLDMSLINSKAGIPFRDGALNLDNNSILENRKNEVRESTLISSSQILKGHK